MSIRDTWWYRQARAKLTGDWTALTEAAFARAGEAFGAGPLALFTSFGEERGALDALRSELDLDEPHLVSFVPAEPVDPSSVERVLFVDGEEAGFGEIAELARRAGLHRFAWAGPDTDGRLTILAGADARRIEKLDAWTPAALRALIETFVRSAPAPAPLAGRAWDFVPPRGLATMRPLALARAAAAEDLGLDPTTAEQELEARYGLPMLSQDAWFFDEE